VNANERKRSDWLVVSTVSNWAVAFPQWQLQSVCPIETHTYPILRR